MSTRSSSTLDMTRIIDNVAASGVPHEFAENFFNDPTQMQRMMEDLGLGETPSSLQPYGTTLNSDEDCDIGHFSSQVLQYKEQNARECSLPPEKVPLPGKRDLLLHIEEERSCSYRPSEDSQVYFRSTFIGTCPSFSCHPIEKLQRSK